MSAYLPEMFSETEQMTVALNIKTIALMQIQQVRDGVDNQHDIDVLNNLLLDMNKPENWNYGDKNNYIVRNEKSFTKLCALLRKEGIPYPEDMPVLQFYTNIELIKERAKQNR